MKYLPALEEAILSEDPLFAENGLRAAYEHRLPVAESTILAVHRLIIWYPYALDLLSVSEGNYRALIEIFAACVSSLQQGITADILARKYADTHAAELFRLFSASTYPEVRRMAALLGLRFGFDLTALRNDPDGHVRRAASPDQNEGQILNENRKDR